MRGARSRASLLVAPLLAVHFFCASTGQRKGALAARHVPPRERRPSSAPAMPPLPGDDPVTMAGPRRAMPFVRACRRMHFVANVTGVSASALSGPCLRSPLRRTSAGIEPRPAKESALRFEEMGSHRRRLHAGARRYVRDGRALRTLLKPPELNAHVHRVALALAEDEPGVALQRPNELVVEDDRGTVFSELVNPSPNATGEDGPFSAGGGRASILYAREKSLKAFKLVRGCSRRRRPVLGPWQARL
jgi:hypothetical protein